MEVQEQPITEGQSPVEASVDTPWIIDEVFSVTSGSGPSVYMVDLEYSGGPFDADHQRAMYSLLPDDPYGLAPTLRQWMLDNPTFPITPYVPPPPQPYYLQVETLWTRMTDEEAESFDTAMSTASPLRLRKSFGTASSILSTSELFAFVKGVLTTTFNAARADQLMAQ